MNFNHFHITRHIIPTWHIPLYYYSALFEGKQMGVGISLLLKKSVTPSNYILINRTFKCSWTHIIFTPKHSPSNLFLTQVLPIRFHIYYNIYTYIVRPFRIIIIYKFICISEYRVTYRKCVQNTYNWYNVGFSVLFHFISLVIASIPI